MHRVHSSANKDVRFTASNVHVRPDIGKTLHMQKLAIDARGLKLEIHSSDAPAKYVGRRAHLNTPAKYMHLNMRVMGAMPQGATGPLAELSGVSPMSSETEALVIRL